MSMTVRACRGARNANTDARRSSPSLSMQMNVYENKSLKLRRSQTVSYVNLREVMQLRQLIIAARVAPKSWKVRLWCSTRLAGRVRVCPVQG